LLEGLPAGREPAAPIDVHAIVARDPYADLAISPTDSLLWEHARAQRLAIVSKDTDFSDRIMLSSPPPWIVRLAFGNLRLRDYHALLARAWPQIEALLPAHKLVIVHANRIEAVKD
jgi:predicted nuclease of predicted toxin-antitoxin system